MNEPLLTDSYGPRDFDTDEFDQFVHRKTRILNTKLEVLAFELHHRLIIRTENLSRIEADKEHATEMLLSVQRQANYLMRPRKDEAPHQKQLFELERERRQQDVEAWRDVAMLMRDFLYAWEAHELAKSKAMFLDHV